MVARIFGAENKIVRLVVDGKQKVLANEYTIVTLGFLVSSESLVKTRLGKGRQEAHTSTQEPFLQALMNSESAENMTFFFQEACALAEQQTGVDLRHQVWQVHKDYAAGIEKARITVFPNARPCDDFAHMRRASYKKLASMLNAQVASRP